MAGRGELLARIPVPFDGTFRDVTLSCGWEDGRDGVEPLATLRTVRIQELSKLSC